MLRLRGIRNRIPSEQNPGCRYLRHHDAADELGLSIRMLSRLLVAGRVSGAWQPVGRAWVVPAPINGPPVLEPQLSEAEQLQVERFQSGSHDTPGCICEDPHAGIEPDALVDALSEQPGSVVVYEKHDGHTTMRWLDSSDRAENVFTGATQSQSFRAI